MHNLTITVCGNCVACPDTPDASTITVAADDDPQLGVGTLNTLGEFPTTMLLPAEICCGRGCDIFC